MTTKPKIIAREAAEPSVPPTEIWCASGELSDVFVFARNAGIKNGCEWALLSISRSGVYLCENVSPALGLPLDGKGRLKIAE